MDQGGTFRRSFFKYFGKMNNRENYDLIIFNIFCFAVTRIKIIEGLEIFTEH